MRVRVRQVREDCWEVVWGASRRFTSERAAREAAERLPSGARMGRRQVELPLRTAILRLGDIGLGPTVIARLLSFLEIEGPSGSTTWSRGTVHSVLSRERQARAATQRVGDDELAR